MAQSKPQGKTGPLATLPPVTAAAVVVAAVMYPVDVVRALCMASPGLGPGAALNGFIGQHGYSGFLTQGFVPEMCRGSFSRMIKFWAQPIVHENIFGLKQKDGTPITKGLAGAAATIPEIIAISPFENFKLAEQLDTQKRFSGPSFVMNHVNPLPFLGKAAEIAGQKGIGGLYAGFGVKAVYLGGSGALLSLLVPRFKAIWGCAEE